MAKPVLLSKQRSQWEHLDTLDIMGVKTEAWRRNVSDGMLRVLVGEEPHGWHLSISFANHKGECTRYPRWDEISDARGRFLSDELGFVMHMPPSEHYVSLHDTTFHLYQYPSRDECDVKHCEEPATVGMTWRFGDVRVEFYVCERHFDEIGAVDEVGPPEAAI